MFKKKKTYVILVIIIAVVVGVWYAKSKKTAVTYTTEKAERGTLVRTVSVTGEVNPPLESNLSFKVGGQVSSILVKIGDHVEKGDKIAVVSEGTLRSQLAQAQFELDAQKKTLDNMERRSDTYNYFQKEAQRKVIKAAEEAVSQIETQIRDTVLYAPISGTVISKNLEEGEVAVANTTVVATIAGDGDLEIKANVPESDIVNVAVGQKSKITLDAFDSSEELEGTVAKINPASTVISDVVYYEITLAFSHQDARFKVGMSADADINTFQKENVVMIAQRAVKDDSGQKYVEILQGEKKEQKAERVNVKTGMKGDDGMIEVVSGLSGGEDVVVLTN